MNMLLKSCSPSDPTPHICSDQVYLLPSSIPTTTGRGRLLVTVQGASRKSDVADASNMAREIPGRANPITPAATSLSPNWPAPRSHPITDFHHDGCSALRSLPSHHRNIQIKHMHAKDPVPMPANSSHSQSPTELPLDSRDDRACQAIGCVREIDH
jgi:hypothetical protein